MQSQNKRHNTMKYQYIFGVFAIICIIIIASMLGFLLFDTFKRWATMKFYQFKKFFLLTMEKLSLLKRLWKEINRTYLSHSIELLFQLYVHFYEENYDDIEGWEFVPELFPNGKNDLMELYKWIKKTRPTNYEEYQSLNYDYTKEMFEYWGSHYQFLKYKIDEDGELKIHPIDYIEAEHPDKMFSRVMMKLQNELYSLDTVKAQWIIERRKFLKI